MKESNCAELEYMADNLFGNGWRAEDREELQEEYGFTDHELGTICELLEEYDNNSNEE